MGAAVLTLRLRTPEDVLLTRRRARDMAALLQLGARAQNGLATAVWEAARGAGHRGGTVEFAVEDEPGPAIVVTVSGPGSDALEVEALQDPAGGIVVARENGGSTVRLRAALAPDTWMPDADELAMVLGSLNSHEAREADPTVEELRQQNGELMAALDQLLDRERDLVELNHALTDTNRAVTALLGELERQAGELRDRAVTTARFLSSLTHELRTPLYAVRGMTEAVLRDYGELDPTLREDIRLIDRAMVEALELVNDHLDLARLAAGRTTVQVRDVRVPELFSTLRGICLRLPRPDGVELLFDDPADVPVLRTDAFKLAQILRNYIANGLKYTEAGSVRVSAAVIDAGEAVRFAVADTGPGLADEDRERVFEEFVRLGEERHGEMRSSGLGLPLVRQLATLLGGDVGVDSEPGRGSTFTATIPVRLPEVEGAMVRLVEE